MSTVISAPAAVEPQAAASDAHTSAIELRLLGAHETQLVHRLALLDDASDLDGQILVAIIGGQGIAALSLNDQRVVANPFIPTAEAVALLRLRAAQLSNGQGRAPVLRRALRSWAVKTSRTVPDLDRS